MHWLRLIHRTAPLNYTRNNVPLTGPDVNGALTNHPEVHLSTALVKNLDIAVVEHLTPLSWLQMAVPCVHEIHAHDAVLFVRTHMKGDRVVPALQIYRKFGST